MFQPSGLQKLYPHLNFSRIAPPSVTMHRQPNVVRSTSVHSNKSTVSDTKTEKIEKMPIKEEEKEEITQIERPKEEVVKKKVKVVDPVKIEDDKLEHPKLEEKIEPKKKVARPNRVKTEPKPEPERESQIPVKGERGLQKKYSQEQRKQIYLDRLSRKSVKNAEKEIAKVNEVLESAKHDPTKLKEIEREVKGKLKLINYAKYFAQSNDETTNINAKKEEKLIRNLSKQSERPEVSQTTTEHSESISVRGRGRSRSNPTPKSRDPSPDNVDTSDGEAGRDDDGVSVSDSGSESG
jgi:hypothetical protein